MISYGLKSFYQWDWSQVFIIETYIVQVLSKPLSRGCVLKLTPTPFQKRTIKEHSRDKRIGLSKILHVRCECKKRG